MLIARGSGSERWKDAQLEADSVRACNLRCESRGSSRKHNEVWPGSPGLCRALASIGFHRFFFDFGDVRLSGFPHFCRFLAALFEA